MKFTPTFATALIVILFQTGIPAYAADPPHPGKALYEKYCQSCHGADGKGDGPVAADLKTKPADLTQLARQNGGEFPFAATVNAVDGRTRIRAHGSSEMPVWGERLQAEITNPGETRKEARVRGTIRLIVDYIRTMQVE